MVNYSGLRAWPWDSETRRAEKADTVPRLQRLRCALDAHFADAGTTPHSDRSHVRLASWNLREFDSGKYGGRTDDAMLFIAEIMARFDIIAVQEVNKDLAALDDLLRLLGPGWTYIATDQAPASRGADERFAFVYNETKVWSRKIAGEVTLSGRDRMMLPDSFDFLPDGGLEIELPQDATLDHPEKVYSKKHRDARKLTEDAVVPLPPGTRLHLREGGSLVFKSGHIISAEKEIDLKSGQTRRFEDTAGLRIPTSEMDAEEQQLARPPFFATFQSGWLKLALCTVHIYYGSDRDSSAKMARRTREIAKICESLGDRAREENDSDSDSYFFVLGDFNIVGKGHGTMQALETNGFRIPPRIQEIPEGTNVKRDKFYDQIAYWAETPRRRRQGMRDYSRIACTSAGVFDFFDHVFTEAEADSYAEVMIREKQRTNAQRDRESKKPLTSKWKFLDWRTHQMSDHLPMWIEMQTDFADDYLDGLAAMTDTDATG